MCERNCKQIPSKCSHNPKIKARRINAIRSCAPLAGPCSRDAADAK